MRSRATDPETRDRAFLSGALHTADRPGALNVAWADRFVAALHAAGVRDALVCSGSRSAPLALALDRSPITTRVSLDERAAAFFALGLAKASRRPVALVCTSGSAAANFFPAIVEASSARVPLIVATADRPPELRDTGAPQTIDQLKLFGNLVRWFVEVGTPEDSRAMLDYAASLGTRAAAEAWRPPAGPVHLNFAFREPLLPEPDALQEPPPSAAEAQVAPEPLRPPLRAIERLAKTARSLRRGLLVCGPDDGPPAFAGRIARLSEITGYPVLADPLSQVRYGRAPGAPILGSYDAFLRAATFADRFGPEVVIQFGAALTSKAFHAYAARHPAAVHVIVDPAGAWRSPARRAREVVTANPEEVAEALVEMLEGSADPLPSWREEFERADRVAREVISRHLETDAFREGKVLPALLETLPETGTLYVGNSMAIRDLDTFAPAHPRRLRVLANRGASGIDGVVSSALGASAASEGPLLLVTGDLSFHHDLNALHMARGERAGTTIVVVHNDGGGIFSFLPAARHSAFERYFGTPHGLDFAPVAAMYGIPHSRPRSWDELKRRAAASLDSRATELIEIQTDREENRAWHQAVWDDVVSAIGRAIA
jgi:2-succinyl-5-enolpyruvyl-6-hydroxy-3-cyclohexene-1-carboxylate synthase